MPKFISTIGIPEPYFSARAAFVRAPRDHAISITELLSPPRVIALKRRHWTDVDAQNRPSFVVDVDHLTGAFYGGAAHAFIEAMHDRAEKREGAPSRYLSEETLEMPHHGWKVTGRPDLYHEPKIEDLHPEAKALLPEGYRQPTVGVITDWKTMRAGSWKRKSANDYREVKQQLDLYGFLLRWTGFNPILGYIGITITDWSQFGRGSAGGGYPAWDYIGVWYRLAPREDAARLFAERFGIHRNAAGMAEEDLPVCTAEERWRREEGWAVMRTGNKKPTKVFWQSNEEPEGAAKIRAVAFVAEQFDPTEYTLDHRPGEAVRCQPKWCLAYQVCKPGQAFRAAHPGEE